MIDRVNLTVLGSLLGLWVVDGERRIVDVGALGRRSIAGRPLVVAGLILVGRLLTLGSADEWPIKSVIADLTSRVYDLIDVGLDWTVVEVLKFAESLGVMVRPRRWNRHWSGESGGREGCEGGCDSHLGLDVPIGGESIFERGQDVLEN